MPEVSQFGMTAEEAFERSSAGVIRNRHDAGLLSIARSPEGYHLSEIPRSQNNVWDLAHTRTVGKWRVLGRALAEAENRGAKTDNWEPAPENIIGNEPAVSVAPAPERTEFRTHGSSRRRIRGFAEDRVRFLAGTQLAAAAMLAGGTLAGGRRAGRVTAFAAALMLTATALYALREESENGSGG